MTHRIETVRRRPWWERLTRRGEIVAAAATGLVLFGVVSVLALVAAPGGVR